MYNVKIKFIKALTLSLFVSHAAFAENPCPDSSQCKEISYQDALAMSQFFEEGIRDYEMISNYKLLIEGDYGSNDQMTYGGSGCYANAGHNERNDRMTSYESYRNERNAYTKGARSSSGSWRGLQLTNKSTVSVELVMKFREVYLLEKRSETKFSLAMNKEIINGKIPEIVNYKFALNEVQPNCFTDETVPFETLEVIYNENSDHLMQNIAEALGVSTRKSYQLGDSSSGFYRPENLVSSDKQVSQTEGAFGYSIRERQTDAKGTEFLRSMRAHIFDNNFGSGGEIYEASAMTKSYKEDAKLFMSSDTVATNVEFWLSPSTREMFMVFSGDGGAKPVRFKMKEENGNFSFDGEFVKYENKTVSAFVILSQLNAMTKMMRASAYRRSYGILSDNIANFKDLLTNPDENGAMRTEVNPEVRNMAHTIFYTTHTLLKQRFEMDTDPDKRRAPVANAMLQQINHMLDDYGFDDVRSGAPLYAIYGSYVKDTITEMRIPGFINKVPPQFSEVDDALSKLFVKAEALKVREGLSDANIKTGKIVDQLIHIYENEVEPLVQSSVENGMVWNGFDLKLNEYMESIKGIRVIDEEEHLGLELIGMDGDFVPTATGNTVDAGKAPKPKRRKN